MIPEQRMPGRYEDSTTTKEEPSTRNPGYLRCINSRYPGDILSVLARQSWLLNPTGHCAYVLGSFVLLTTQATGTGRALSCWELPPARPRAGRCAGQSVGCLARLSYPKELITSWNTALYVTLESLLAPSFLLGRKGPGTVFVSCLCSWTGGKSRLQPPENRLRQDARSFRACAAQQRMRQDVAATASSHCK